MIFAQDYPTRVIKLIVPYPAGGGVDNLARPMADRLSQLFGQPVIVENKAGASTMIGGESVARAAPDGYTLLFTTDSSITSNPFLFKKMPFDPLKELSPVTQLVDLHQMVLLNPSVEAHTLNELVALAKAKPNALNYGSYGPGSQPNLLFEMLRGTLDHRLLLASLARKHMTKRSPSHSSMLCFWRSSVAVQMWIAGVCDDCFDTPGGAGRGGRQYLKHRR
jgi:tripartite-type tricarboxylate transporter receptor subunit TctC